MHVDRREMLVGAAALYRRSASFRRANGEAPSATQGLVPLADTVTRTAG